MYHVRFTKQAAKDAKKLKAAGLDRKAKDIIETVRLDPLKTPPSYKALVGNLSGLYSRRINIQHRFVYEIIPEPFEENGTQYEGTVKVLRMWSHYQDI